MIIIICAIVAILIKDLKMRLSNSNPLLRKSAIWFELLAPKKKQVNRLLIYHIINTKNLFHRRLCLSKEIMSQNLPFASKSNCHYLLKTKIQLGV